MGEHTVDSGLATLGAVMHLPTRALSSGVVDMLERAVTRVDLALDKQAIVDAIESVIPTFAHRETGKTLDDRL